MNPDWKQRAQAAEQVCSEAYQAVGRLASAAGVFETTAVEHLLDNLLAASEGRKPPHETILPFRPGMRHN